jgi:hypothetical protein
MSNLILPTRRSFIIGLGIAAPAVIAASNLMPVRSIIPPEGIIKPDASDLDYALGSTNTEWVLINQNERYTWTKSTYIMENGYLNNLAIGSLKKYDIVQRVRLPARVDYKNVHEGTELLKIHAGTIIA